MTKAKAKALVAELLDRGYAPTIRTSDLVYTVGVTASDGVTSTQVSQVETLVGVTATIYAVEFI